MSDAVALGRGAIACTVAGLTVIVVVAAGVWTMGMSAPARTLLAFDFRGNDRNAGEVLNVASNNLRLAAGLVLAAAIRPALPTWVGLPLDLLVGGILITNALVVGTAIGAYGTPILITVGPHLPCEVTAFACAAAAYIRARREPLARMVLMLVALVTFLLLLAGAVLEILVQLGTAA